MLVALVSAGVIPAEALAACRNTRRHLYRRDLQLRERHERPQRHGRRGATVSVLPLFGGTAMSLTGSGVTLTNNGTIDPSLAGLASFRTHGRR